MGEAIGTAVIELAVKKLVSRSYQEIKSVVDLESEVKRLQETQTIVQAALIDANLMQEHSHVQQDVLEKLSWELNRLVNFLDARAVKSKNNKVVGRSWFIKEACLFFSTSNQFIARFRDARNIMDIGKKLESIARDHARFGSIVSVPSAHQTHAGSLQTAGSHIISDVVIGRDVERNTIISMLSGNFIASETLSVASIVGIGGIGKTTLARYVYHDERVKCCFDVGFWVDATKGFYVEEVLKRILASAMDDMPRRCDIDQLYHHFLEAIAGKKFLLVLDNIWDKEFLRLIWIELKRLLAFGAYGSKVLITTRDQKVATTMDSTSPYMLGDLTEDDSWQLFKQIAFTQLQEPGVKAIGKEIAKMCPNVPLVIRSIGGLLAGKITLKEWKAFRNDQLANFSTYGRDIMHTLKLSYDQLDAKLKLCVAYCSLFPKGFEYDEDEMICLWICMGYVEPQYKNQSLEEAGEAYMLGLLNCGFFQRHDGLKMHDVMHDAVVMLAGHKYKMVDSNTVEFDERVHHVSVGNVVDSSWDVLSSLSKSKYLESFLVVTREIKLATRNWFVYHKVMLPSFQCLKVLDLHGIWIKKLPTSLGELICLRHLDLSETALVKLPNSVLRLVNLLSLKLYSCINLQELPKDMSKLVKLRHLQLSECSELTHVPKGLGYLTDLQTLSLFVVSEKSSRSKFEANVVGGLEELKHLNNLKGELSIQVCKQPKDIVLGAKEANLRRKEKLIDLSIDFWDSTKEDEAVLEGLQPHANLRYLKIQGYGGERLPSWMINDNLHCRLPNLIQIKILNCKSCRYLFHLGRLPYLKDLFLEGLDNVEYIEKYTSSSSNIANDEPSTPESIFPSLETFRLKGIPKLKGWWNMSLSGDHDLRQHHDVQYQNHLTEWRPAFCKLKALTTDSIELAITIAKGPGFASLEHLYIKHNSRVSLPLCEQQTLTPLNTCFPNLRCLQLSGNPKIEALPDEIQDLFYLEYLRIDNCKQLKAIPEWIDSLRSLTSLYIWECPRLESLPHEISNLSNLKLLGISKCSAVLTERCRCKKPTGLYWPFIQHIPYINIRLSNRNPTESRKRRKRSSSFVVSEKSRKLLPFNPTEDPNRRLEQMASLATALMATGTEFSNELTYVPGKAPRTANCAAFEDGEMQVMSKEDTETLQLSKKMMERGDWPPLLVVFDPKEGFTVQADRSIRDLTIITECVGDVNYLQNRENDDGDSMMTLLSASNRSQSLVVCSDKHSNIARFINGTTTLRRGRRNRT